MSTEKRIVKQILSGDSIVLRDQLRNDVPTEQTVLLAFIQSPKIGRVKDSKTGLDEPLAWEAREFVRERLVGKEVTVRTEYTLPASGRELSCVSIYLDDNSPSINESLLAAGLAELNRRKQADSVPESLVKAEADAKAALLGVWAPEKASLVRERVINDLSADIARSLVGKTVTGLVEHVKDGSSLKIGVLMPLEVPDEQRHEYQVITVHLSGVKCQTLDEEFGQMARYFSETRLLNRYVQVRVEQVASLNFVSVVGSVTLGERNIALFLLKEGLARTVDRTIGLVLGGIEPYRAAERVAKQAKLRMWKNWSAPATTIGGTGSSAGTSNEWTGQVIEIVNAECILVEKPGEVEPVKVWFASIRGPKAVTGAAQPIAPKSKDDRAPRTRPLYDVPYMFEAREFLRRKLIGRPVRVIVDYVQQASNALPERLCGTIFVGGEVNVAAALVLKGLATVIKRNDDQKSHAFDDLLQAEVKATAAGKALYSKSGGKGVKLLRPTDVSTDTSRASFQLETLSRGGAKEAIVEFVFSSSKFKLYLVKENLLINLVVGGIQSEKTGKLDQNLVAIRRLLQHHDVKVTVERVDKAGNFIGQLYFTDSSARPPVESASLAHYLVRQGWVKARDDKSPSLLEAQREAQLAQRGVWVGWTDTSDDLVSSTTKLNLNESGDVTSANETTPDSSSTTSTPLSLKSLEKVVVVDAYPQSSDNLKWIRLEVQNFELGPQLASMQQELQDHFQRDPPHPGTYRGKVGDMCAILHPAYHQWYRGVVKNMSASEVKVYLIDYASSAKVSMHEIANFPTDPQFSVKTLPAVGRIIGQAFVSIPTGVFEELEDEAADFIYQAVVNKECRLRPQYVLPNGIPMYTLLDDATGQDLMLDAVRQGWVGVAKRLVGKRERHADKDLEKYHEAMEEARKAHRQFWNYGDFREDDL